MKGSILPRLVRLRDAPAYLGIDKHRFNKEVRPYVTLIPIGIQGIAFDRLDLDAWAEHYKFRSGRPAVANMRSMQLWDAEKCQGSLKEGNTGIFKNGSLDAAFEKVLEQIYSVKPKNFSQDESRK